MRTIFVRVMNEKSPAYAQVRATEITSTTFNIEDVDPDFRDAALEFGAGDNVRCKIIRLRGPGEPKTQAADDRGGADSLKPLVERRRYPPRDGDRTERGRD